MIITEEELREMWQNGRGTIPPFPIGTRFSHAAMDFIASNHLNICYHSGNFNPTNTDQGRTLTNPVSGRTIFTELDILDLAQKGISSIVVNDRVTITDPAREKARTLGIQIINNQGRANQTSRQVETIRPDTKTFYTEADIIEMANRGVTEIEISPNAVFTSLASQKINHLGIKIIASQIPIPGQKEIPTDLFEKVKSAVLARLGNQVNQKILDEVIRKVLRDL